MKKQSRSQQWKRVWGKLTAPFSRAFFGGSRLLYRQLGEERVETPTRLLIKRFLRKKSGVVACVVLVALFLFVFLCPAFFGMDVNYTDALQQNVAPNYTMLSLPAGLRGQIRSVDGFSGFSVGLGKDGKVYVWGDGKDRLTGVDLKEVPESVQNASVAFVAAGKDHAIAVLQDGRVIGWGDDSCGQYGTKPLLNVLPMPTALIGGEIPVEEMSSLSCGYQATALVTKPGKAYFWGNTFAVRNLSALASDERVERVGVQKAVFSNSVLALLLKDGTFYTGAQTYFTSVRTSTGKSGDSLQEYLQGKRAVDIAATNKCVALILDDGEVVVSGVFENDENKLPVLQQGERATSLAAGTRHFVLTTDRGNAYAWGHNAYGQCDVTQNGKTEKVYAGSLQTYLVDGDGNLLQKTGLKGYLMGTDNRGRDVFTRIVHGGKMTMTVGAVAVIISTLIAVSVGCLAGYFGGWVDVLLMRVTEIFSSIPFLPFAMLLSTILRNYAVSEGARIFLIMLILGVLSWTGLAKIIRAQVLAEREKEFVTAAKALGVKQGRIAFRHVLPNVLSVVLVSVTLDFAGCLLTESSLSYLGFGVQQPQPTWGNMLTGANNSLVIQNYWWQWLFPALFLSVATVCINIVGDALREALDPKSSGL